MLHPEKFRFKHCALGFIWPFGKHKNETLKEIIDADPGYVWWAMTKYLIHMDSGTEDSKYVFAKLGQWRNRRFSDIEARAWTTSDWGGEYYSGALGDFV